MSDPQIVSHYQQVQDLFTKHFNGKEIVCGIEIGTKCADLTRTILWALPQCQMYTIDPWRHLDGAQFEAGELQPYHDENKRWAMQRLQLPEFEKRICILEMTSEEAYKWIVEQNPGKKFDFVWVDGDHSEEGIKKDIELYYPLVETGGIFGMHDVGLVHPLTEIVEKEFNHLNLQRGADFTAWIIKT